MPSCLGHLGPGPPLNPLPHQGLLLSGCICEILPYLPGSGGRLCTGLVVGGEVGWEGWGVGTGPRINSTAGKTQISLGPQHILALWVLRGGFWGMLSRTGADFYSLMLSMVPQKMRPGAWLLALGLFRLALATGVYSLSILDLLWFTLQGSALLFRCSRTSFFSAGVLPVGEHASA